MTRISIIILLVLSSVKQNSSAQEKATFFQQDKLTGNWNGKRDTIASKGITAEVDFTTYYQGAFSGTGYNDFDLGGRADALINFDTEKLKLWRGGGIHTHLTYRFGNAPAFRGGALWPVNTGGILPLGAKDKLVATSIYMSQRWNTSMLMIGKINAVDLMANDPFFGGWGNQRFMNLAFVAPPSGVVPPVIIGAIYSYRIKQYILTAMVFDPNDRTKDYWPSDIFANGVNLSLNGQWDGDMFDRKTSFSLGATYSTQNQIDLEEILLPPGLQAGTKSGAYNISAKFSHLLLESNMHQGQGLGIYGRGAIADGNPNPIKSSFSGGLAGHKIISRRPNDSFGIGYFYYDFSDQLRNAVDQILEVGSEQGVEVFYNMALTPWFRISANMAWGRPADRSKDDLFIGSLRVNIRF